MMPIMAANNVHPRHILAHSCRASLRAQLAGGTPWLLASQASQAMRGGRLLSMAGSCDSLKPPLAVISCRFSRVKWSIYPDMGGMRQSKGRCFYKYTYIYIITIYIYNNYNYYYCYYYYCYYYYCYYYYHYYYYYYY